MLFAKRKATKNLPYMKKNGKHLYACRSLVETEGVEPLTLRMRTVRSPN